MLQKFLKLLSSNSKMKPLEFCCEDFKSAVETAPREGIGVFPKEFVTTYRFVLQSRICPFGKEHIAQSTIGFCPWCGCNLGEYIANNKEAIVEFAEKAKIYEDFITRRAKNEAI